jgi:EAL and modified HD-GYP domain-containing signal transduction protein
MATFRSRTEPARAEIAGSEFFLGRQPIVGRRRELIAYELLFRSGQHDFAGVTDDFAATATVIDNLFSSLGIDRALGDRKGFINVSEDVLMSDIIEILPHSRIVLEILEDVPLTSSVLERCQQLRGLGYQLALDDVVTLQTEHKAFLDHIDYVKFDIGGMSTRCLIDLVREVRRHGAIPLAEKVETVEQYDDCKAMGFDLFQGYFFARPVVLSGRRAQPSRVALIRILRLLADADDNHVLEVALKEAPDLAMRVLKTASCAAYSPVSKVTSLRQAIALLGHRQIRQLVQIMLFAQHGGADLGSDPLVQTAAIRGRLMDSLAAGQGLSHLRDEAFTVGILSLADSLLGQSMSELMALLNLEDALRAAVVEHAGPLGRLLSLVEASEGRDQDRFGAIATHLAGTDAMVFNHMQIEAIQWARQL